MKALEAGHTVLFLTLESMITRLTRARIENRTERQLQQFVAPKLLIIDEMGYLPMSRDEAGLFFRLLTRRYEKASTIITPLIRALLTGEKYSMTKCWQPLSLTGFCITVPPLTSREKVTGSKRKERQGSLDLHPGYRRKNMTERTVRMGTYESVVQGTFYFPEKGTKQKLVDNYTFISVSPGRTIPYHPAISVIYIYTLRANKNNINPPKIFLSLLDTFTLLPLSLFEIVPWSS